MGTRPAGGGDVTAVQSPPTVAAGTSGAAGAAEAAEAAEAPVPTLAFLTTHGHALVCIARDPTIRLRDLAAEVGVSLRAIYLILDDLVATEHLERQRHGRRNRYRVNRRAELRHPLLHGRTTGDLLALLAASPAAAAAAAQTAPSVPSAPTRPA